MYFCIITHKGQCLLLQQGLIFCKRIIGIPDLCKGVLQVIIFKMRCIDWKRVQSSDYDEQLTCSICLQFMVSPHTLDCRHVFGKTCIEEWKQSGTNGKQCPLCRKEYTQITPYIPRMLIASRYRAKCFGCGKIQKVYELQKHQQICQIFNKKIRETLDNLIAVQIGHLQKQINPHLREAHGEIYEKYVEDWKWLHWQRRNWKWWWWCSNPWWEKKCPTCNQLWHKYEVDIDTQEDLRVDLIKSYNIEKPVSEMIANLAIE